jgi:hypothetical protein
MGKIRNLLSEVNNTKIPLRHIILLIIGIPISILAGLFLWLITRPHFYLGEKIGDFIGNFIGKFLIQIVH